MARFDPDLPDTTQNVPEWFRYIRGFDKSVAERGSQMGKFVGDIGQAADTIGKTYGEVNDIKIQNRAYDLIDPIRNKFGVEEATRLAQQGIPPTSMKGDSSSLVNSLDPTGAPTAGRGSSVTTPGGSPNTGAPSQEGSDAVSGVTDFSSVSRKQAPSQGQGVFSPNPQSSSRSIQGAPAGAQRLGQRVADLQKAYDAGEASPSYYFANLNAAVSQLRSEFPEFREVIDKHVQTITGVNPANALRTQLLHDMDIAERQKNASGNAMWNFMKNPDNMGIIERTYPGIYQHPEKYPGISERDLISTVAEYNAKRGEHKDLIADIEDENKTQDARTKAAQSLLAERASLVGGQKVKGILGLASNGNVEQWLQAELARTGGHPKTTDIQDYANKSNLLKQGLETEWNKLLAERVNPDNPKSVSLGALIARDPAKAAEMKKNFIDSHSQFIDAMYNQHYGLVQANQRWVTGHNENVARTVAEQYPNLAAVKVLNENLGNDWKNGVDKEVTAQILGDGLKAVRLGNLAESVDPQHKDNSWGPPSLQRYLNDTKRNQRGQLPPEEFGVTEMNDHVRHFVDPSTPLESKKRLATALFSNDMTFPKGYINMYRPEMWPQVLATMAGPKVSKEIANLGDEKITRDYVAWVKRNAGAALRADILNIQGQIENRNDIKVHFEPTAKGGEFYVERTMPQAAGEFQEPPPLYSEISHVNQILRTIEPALKLSGGGISDEIAGFAADQGIDISKSGTAGKPTPTGELIKSGVKEFGNMVQHWLSNPYYRLKTPGSTPTKNPDEDVLIPGPITKEGREDIK